MIRLLRYGVADRTPVLVAIPGIDGSIGSIAPIVDALGKRRSIVVVDYTGEDNATLEGLTAEIAARVQETISGPIDLLGQSIGTIVAAQLAAVRGLRGRKVVLIGTFTRLRWLALRVSNALVRVSPRPLYRVMTPPMMALVCGPVGDGRRHPFFAAARASDPAAAVRRTAWEIDRDFTPDLSRFTQPALVLMGERDRFVPNAAREIVKIEKLFVGRPGTVVPIPDAGHVLLPSAAIANAVGRIEAFLT